MSYIYYKTLQNNIFYFPGNMSDQPNNNNKLHPISGYKCPPDSAETDRDFDFQRTMPPIAN
jgi:hypothetical protein